MNARSLTVEEFNQLLQQWSGETIIISKQELDDEDIIIMQLNDISYDRHTRRMDEYEPMHSLHLNGTGTTETDGCELQPLPDSLYEIPLEDSTQYRFDENRFFLITERGRYIIERVL
ncbi:hypothetical protein GCM10010954_16190 [Halobacillus andaensis]|uniref:Uncharacterized protein n=1 Tax=Halobacillus andaensis TaxID=1176239 RepID=A0A917EUY2_HALAA|nr:hypothetical protein [Halobacillus andaensis]MBP2004879.1 hypothetical protein [Halobacillus andaensis]GGF18209.1 hypothetical protein GCM10010954_16190 [Halobacillus andaensis]